MRTRIKICGIRDSQSARAAADAGADAIGLVFYAGSPRAVTLQQAQSIAATLPAFVASVALFMDAARTEVQDVVEQMRPDLLQFHGSESAEYCRSFGLPYLKAVAMGGEVDLPEYFASYADARGLLLDSHAPGKAGGSGEAFDWNKAIPKQGPSIILAGGLHPDNVGQAIASMRPYGVDVSSGVESAPGVKDLAKIQAFTNAVRRADKEYLN